MGYLSNVVFVLMLVSTSLIFYLRVKKIRRNIFFGVGYKRIDDKWERLKIMMRVAIGQSKMSKRPFSAALHIVVYLGFVIINIEILEIVLDGILGTHRLFAEFLGSFYNFLIGFFEYLALGVIVVCVIFLARRFSKRIKKGNTTSMLNFAEIAKAKKTPVNFNRCLLRNNIAIIKYKEGITSLSPRPKEARITTGDNQ